MKTVIKVAIWSEKEATHELKEQLSQCGCIVLVLDRGDVKEQLDNTKLALLVVDMSGRESINPNLFDQAIKKQIPIIRIYPANTPVRELLNVIHKGEGDCIRHPYSIEALSLSIERCLFVKKLVALEHSQKQRKEKSVSKLRRHTRILETDQIAGRQLQRMMLPASPIAFGNYVAECLIIPSLYLSGDFINYQKALEQYFLFLLTDVAGHGASSAFITAMMKQQMSRIIRRQILNRDVDALGRAPKGFIEHINKELLGNGLEKHLTAVAGSIDFVNNRLRYVIGGHSPLPILVHEGKARLLEGKGDVVGLLEKGEWHVEELDLPDKFVLYCFSDGLLEALPETEVEKNKQFLLEQLPSCPPSVEEVLPHLGVLVDEPPDDVAILMLKRGC